MSNPFGSLSVLMVLVSAMFASTASGQQSCTVAARHPDNAYTVKIDAESYLAISRQEYIKKENELQKAQEDIKQLSEMVANLEANKAQRDMQIAELDQLIAKHKEYADKLKIADEKCERALRACLGSGRLVLDAGVGMTGSSEPAAMLGVGYGKLRAWGFFQSGNSGALVGVSWPLF